MLSHECRAVGVTEIEVTIKRLLVINGEFGAVLGGGGDGALLDPGEIARGMLGEDRFLPFSGCREFSGELGFSGGDLGVEIGQTLLLIGSGESELTAPGVGATVGNEAGFFDIGKEGLHGVEVFGLEGIELMVMTFGATESGTEPDGTERAHAVGAVFGYVFLGLEATFGGDAIEAVIG